jgi:ribosomal-protein-serine acetyltransferase
VAESDLHNAEIGYSILREFRGKGIATEAVLALVAEGFTTAELRSMRAYCVPENAASRRVLERSGFVFDKVLPRGACVNGETVDILAHVLTRENWIQSGNAMEIPASA